jgi:hypothetical protein
VCVTELDVAALGALAVASQLCPRQQSRETL